MSLFSIAHVRIGLKTHIYRQKQEVSARANTKGRRNSAADSKLFAQQMTQMARMDVAVP